MANSQQQSVRTTIRVNPFKRGSPPSSSSSSDTIYYLKTSTPHLYDFSLFGPFHVLDAIVPSLHTKLQATSPAGLAMFEDLMAAGGIAGFQHIKAPLPGPENHTMTVELVEEVNPEVLAILPGPAWTVVISEILPDYDASDPKLKSQELRGTFISAEKANNAARELLRDVLKSMRGGQAIDMPRADGGVDYAVVSAKESLVIEVRLDRGDAPSA